MITDKTTAIVTGANSGLGFVTAGALADKGMRVIIACRSESRANEALIKLNEVPGRDISYMQLDLADFSSVRAFAERFSGEYPRLDVLVNNAGILSLRRKLTRDGFESHFGVNYLGHFLLTMLLLPKLEDAPQGRIVMLSSLAHKWTDIHFDDINLEHGYSVIKGYGQSKLCTLMFARELARRLAEANSRVTINAAHPGIVATNIIVNRETGVGRVTAKLSRIVLTPPEKGARTSVFLACDKSVESVSGEYFGDCKVLPSTEYSHDPDVAKKLFELSMKLTGLDG